MLIRLIDPSCKMAADACSLGAWEHRQQLSSPVGQPRRCNLRFHPFCIWIVHFFCHALFSKARILPSRSHCTSRGSHRQAGCEQTVGDCTLVSCSIPSKLHTMQQNICSGGCNLSWQRGLTAMSFKHVSERCASGLTCVAGVYGFASHLMPCCRQRTSRTRSWGCNEGRGS